MSHDRRRDRSAERPHSSSISPPPMKRRRTRTERWERTCRPTPNDPCDTSPVHDQSISYDWDAHDHQNVNHYHDLCAAVCGMMEKSEANPIPQPSECRPSESVQSAPERTTATPLSEGSKHASSSWTDYEWLTSEVRVHCFESERSEDEPEAPSYYNPDSEADIPKLTALAQPSRPPSVNTVSDTVAVLLLLPPIRNTECLFRLSLFSTREGRHRPAGMATVRNTTYLQHPPYSSPYRHPAKTTALNMSFPLLNHSSL